MEEVNGFMGYEGIAELTGIKIPVLQKYQSEARRREREGAPRPGDMPAPDWRVSGAPLWKKETIGAWLESRPGRGVGGGRLPEGQEGRFEVVEVLPSGREVIRGTYARRAVADERAYDLNTDFNEENHHFVRRVAKAAPMAAPDER